MKAVRVGGATVTYAENPDTRAVFVRVIARDGVRVLYESEATTPAEVDNVLANVRSAIAADASRPARSRRTRYPV